MTCALSAILPRPPEAPRPHNAASKRGDRGHLALHRFLMGARREDYEAAVLPADLFDLDELTKNVPAIKPIAGLPYTEVECWFEPLSQDAISGVATTPQPPGYYRGTADMLGLWNDPAMGPMPAVCDLKTGSPRHQVQADAAQLGFFALWLSCRLKAPMVASFVYLSKVATEPPRKMIWTPKHLKKFGRAFADYEARLCLLERNDEVPEPVVSKECFWCPAKPNCKAWRQDEKGKWVEVAKP